MQHRGNSQYFIITINECRASLVVQTVKNLPAKQQTQVQSLCLEDPWRRAWQPTPVFLPGEFHGQRSLESYSPWGCRVGHDWVTNTHTHTTLIHYKHQDSGRVYRGLPHRSIPGPPLPIKKLLKSWDIIHIPQNPPFGIHNPGFLGSSPSCIPITINSRCPVHFNQWPRWCHREPAKSHLMADTNAIPGGNSLAPREDLGTWWQRKVTDETETDCWRTPHHSHSQSQDRGIKRG